MTLARQGVKAVILAGGRGTRLHPLTLKVPKPMINIAGEPCINYVIQSIVKAGVREFIVTTGYMSDILIRSIGDGEHLGASILYSFEDKPAGTAGAVKKVERFLEGTFLVASGDVLADVDIGALYDYHVRKGGIATMALTRVEKPTEFGIVGLDDENRIVRFMEKPREEEVFSNLVNAGIYVLEPEIMDYIETGKAVDFSKNVFPKLLAAGKEIYGMELSGVWNDIGRPHDLLKATLQIIERSSPSPVPTGIDASGKVIIEPGAVIERGVRIEGPAYIGSGVHLAEGSRISCAALYENVSIGNDVLVENSILFDSVRVGSGSGIKGSIVSPGCEIGKGVILSETVIPDGIRIKAHSRMEGVSISPSDPLS